MHLPVTLKKLTICFCLLIISVSAALAQKFIKVDSSHVNTIRLDPANAVGGTASDFFTEVNYIPLETTKESLFGSIAKLEVTDDYYVILDQNTHSILIFTKTGKFHAKIKSSENNKNNYIYTFSINKWDKQIIFSRDGFKTQTYCDYDGNIVKTAKLGGELAKDEIDRAELWFMAPDKTISYSYENRMEPTDKYYKTYSKSLIVYASANHKVYAQGLPFQKSAGKIEYSYSGSPLTNFGIDTAYFYSKSWDYAIYTVTPNGIKFSYKFIFPLLLSLPLDFMTNTLYADKKWEWMQRNRDVITGLGNFYQTGNNLIFKTFSYNGSDNKEDNLIYNLKSGSTIAYKHITQDERSYFLPIYDPTGWTFNERGILACKDSCIYTAVSSVGMFKSYNDNAEQKVKYPPALAEYFKKGSIRDNPAILQLKIKDDL